MVAFGEAVVIDVLGNDSEPDGHALDVGSLVPGTPAAGTAEVVAGGWIRYTPTTGGVDADQFTYSICDDQSPAACVSATVVVTIVPAPALTPDKFFAAFEQPIVPLVAEITGGQAPYSFMVLGAGDPLPTGLSLDPDTGTITGAVTRRTDLNQIFTVQIQVMDATGAQVASTIEIETVEFELSPLYGQVVISEILWNQGFVLDGEFVELANLSGAPIDLKNVRLTDVNPVQRGDAALDRDDFDVTLPNFSISDTGRSTFWLAGKIGDSAPGSDDKEYELGLGCDPAIHTCSLFFEDPFFGGVVEVTSTETWAFLANEGDDVYLLDEDGRLIDYVAYGDGPKSGPEPTLEDDVWDESNQTTLGDISVFTSISISLATEDATGLDSSSCYEVTGATANTAVSLGCPGASSTHVTHTQGGAEFGLAPRRTNVSDPEFP